jgi:hypothetical protein
MVAEVRRKVGTGILVPNAPRIALPSTCTKH